MLTGLLPEPQTMSEYAVIELVEEFYHATMAYLATYALIQDTYYAAKPKRHFSVPDIVMIIFHSIFLGRHLLCHAMPRKLLYLVDMLLHVCHLFSDVMLMVALVHCKPEPLQLATGRMLWGGSCHMGSLIAAIVSFIYQIVALIIYYNRLGVTNADDQPGYMFACLFWIYEALHYTLQHLDSGPDAELLSEELEVEHTLRTEEVCSASFELRYRPAAAGCTGRCTAKISASATLRENNSNYC